jgi:hypothetical protein
MSSTAPQQEIFEHNVSFTIAVNGPGEEPLTYDELWEGVRRGGLHPHDFADYVADCHYVEGTPTNFKRKLIIAKGAVHTDEGQAMVQDVEIAVPLYVSIHPP